MESRRSLYRYGMAIGLAAAALPSLAFAQNVTVDGFVKNSVGFGVANVDLDWFNQDLDMEIDPTGDHTNDSGYFSVVIPVGRYDITVLPAAGSGYAPVFLPDIDLEDSQTLDDTIVPDGALTTAHVQNGAGAPLSNMRFKFFDLDIDEFVYVHDDQSDLTGDFASMVPLGDYVVNVVDRDGVYGPGGLEVTISADTDLGTIVLEPGVTVNGHVQDGASNPIFNVEVVVIDEATGATLFSAGAATDFFGDFSTFIGNGTYEFLYVPSSGSPFAPKRVRDVTISGNTTLPPVVLPAARTVTGTVVNDVGAPFQNVDINVFDLATGDQLYTPDDNTNASGFFSVIVGSGLYDFTFNPPAGSGFAAGVRRDVTITTSTSLGTIALVRGIQISGLVTGGGTPIADVDFDFIEPATGDVYPTPGDDTDANGMYAVRIPAGLYEILVTPPIGSGYAPKTIAAAMYTTDTVLDVELDPAVAVPSADAIRARLELAPNPFQVGVHLSLVRLDVPDETPITVSVFDAQGRLVREFATSAGIAGATGLTWDGRDKRGERAAPGSYFFRVRAGQAAVGAKAVLVR